MGLIEAILAAVSIAALTTASLSSTTLLTKPNAKASPECSLRPVEWSLQHKMSGCY